MAEVRVLLADDLAVKLVLADRPGERTGNADRSRPVCDVPGEKETLPRQNLAFEATHQAARHLHIH